MKEDAKRAANIIIIYTGFLVTGLIIFSINLVPDVFPFYGRSILYWLVLAVVLPGRFNDSITPGGPIKKLLLAISVLMILWFVLQGAKYTLFWDSEGIRRMLWYMYYIPDILIPTGELGYNVCEEFRGGFREDGEASKEALHRSVVP